MVAIWSVIPPGRMVDLGGRSLHADVRGNGGPVVVLEAGIAASSISWALVQDRIAAFTTVVSYDRAGFGFSRDSARHRSTALAAAQELAVLLERLETPGPFVLVGHSFGGLIARIFQQNYPERVAGLVLLDPVSRTEWARPSPRLKKLLARGVALSKRGAMLAHAGVVGVALKILLSGSRFVPKIVARVSAAGDGSGVTQRLAAEVGKLPRKLWPVVAAHWSEARCFEAMADSLENLPISAKQIQEGQSLGDLPVLVFSAPTSDRVVIEEHEREARLSTRGEHIVLRGAGHWIQLDAPDAVVEAIRRVCELSP
jgi:pimeloyl-ACP methyl ester carboxylesterase